MAGQCDAGGQIGGAHRVGGGHGDEQARAIEQGGRERSDHAAVVQASEVGIVISMTHYMVSPGPRCITLRERTINERRRLTWAYSRRIKK